MKRNPAGGAAVPVPGGYQREAKRAGVFGLALWSWEHEHAFVDHLADARYPPLQRARCRVCGTSRGQVREQPQ